MIGNSMPERVIKLGGRRSGNRCFTMPFQYGSNIKVSSLVKGFVLYL